MKATKKRNPQDSTRRNVQAANKRLTALTARVRTLEAAVKALTWWKPSRPRRTP